MNFNDAVFQIEECIERMKRSYGSAVFDEWLIADFRKAPGKALYYSGPRATEFEEKFASDVEGLRAALFSHDYLPGDFEFSRRSGGTRYDTFIVLAPRIYLICNHTSEAISDIKKNEKWRKAQLPYFELADKFRYDPLAL